MSRGRPDVRPPYNEFMFDIRERHEVRK